MAEGAALPLAGSFAGLPLQPASAGMPEGEGSVSLPESLPPGELLPSCSCRHLAAPRA
jgi:hypothetical protein